MRVVVGKSEGLVARGACVRVEVGDGQGWTRGHHRARASTSK